MANAETALDGERIAARWLESQGWEILDRNWTRDIGELDLVVSRRVDWGVADVRLIAFVEVKSRETGRGLRGTPGGRRCDVTTARSSPPRLLEECSPS